MAAQPQEVILNAFASQLNLRIGFEYTLDEVHQPDIPDIIARILIITKICRFLHFVLNRPTVFGAANAGIAQVQALCTAILSLRLASLYPKSIQNSF